MAVNDGLTIFNLKDGVVDEFNSEDGIDTAENTNATYDSTEDFYTNDSTAPSPATTNIQAFWHNDGTFNDNESTDGGGASNNEVSPFTYTAPPTAKAVDLLVIGGGGAGGLGVTGSMVGSGGGGGAGGLIFLENLPVTGGATYSVTVGEGGEGKGYPGPGLGEDGGDTTFVYSPSVNIIGEGGGAGGYTSGSQRPGGSGGGLSNQPPVGTTGGTGTQATNHPVTGISDFEGTPYPNSPPSFSAEGSEQVGSFGNPSSGSPQVWGFGGGGAGSTTSPNGHPQGGNIEGGEGLDYNIVDGSTAIGFAGGGAGGYPGGQSGEGGGGDEGGRSGGEHSSKPGVANTGGGGCSGGISEAGNGADGRVVVAVSRHTVSNTSMTLVSDTFTASTTPSTARIVVFAELPDGTSDFTVSATRDNTNYNNITLTDEGYAAGSSGTKIFTGSTPLTGAAPGQPQVQVRWKIVGSSLSGNNKIHGVALQWK
jgi:hypothetical protein